MSSIPTVSIIISAYEGIGYLPATIDSILQQTYSDFEILVFTDNYRQICSWFKQQPDRRLRFIPHLSLATAFNRGITEARGKYIAFIQPGDLWHADKLAKQVSALDHHQEFGLVHSYSISIDLQGHLTSKIVKQGCLNTAEAPKDFDEVNAARKAERGGLGGFPAASFRGRSSSSTTGGRMPTQPSLQEVVAGVSPVETVEQESPVFLKRGTVHRSEILAQNRLNLSTVMLRRQCFEVVGLFDPNLTVIPDWEMWIRLRRYYHFMAVTEPLVYLRQYPTGFRHDCNKLELDLQTMIEKVYARLPLEQSSQKQISYGYASLFLAEQTLYHKHPDAAVACNYLYQALQHDPLLALTPKFFRLRWSLFMLPYRRDRLARAAANASLKDSADHKTYRDPYSTLARRHGYFLLLLTQIAIERLQSFASTVKKLCQKITDWMLEEEDSIIFLKKREVERQGKD